MFVQNFSMHWLLPICFITLLDYFLMHMKTKNYLVALVGSGMFSDYICISNGSKNIEIMRYLRNLSSMLEKKCTSIQDMSFFLVSLTYFEYLVPVNPYTCKSVLKTATLHVYAQTSGDICHELACVPVGYPPKLS